MEAAKARYDELGMEYELAYGDDTNLCQMVQIFSNQLASNAHILECGSGTGRPVASTVACSGREIHGIDLSSGMVELAQKRVPEGTFEVANMLEFKPFKQHEGIIASLSTNSLSREELSTMSNKWFEWMKPGGLLLINTFRGEDCKEQVKMFDADGLGASGVKWRFMNRIVSITVLTTTGWKVMLQKAGFEIMESQTDDFIPAPEFGCDDEPRLYIIAKKTAHDIC